MDLLKTKRLILKYCCICVFFSGALTNNSVSAQKSTMLVEKRFYTSSIDYALDNLIEEQKEIYTGPLYFQYFIKMGNDGHPFFYNLQPESITYDGIAYSVDFIYDTFLDEIVIVNPDSNWISLNKNKISCFSLGGHEFKKIDDTEGLSPGFYEMIYKDNNISLIARWTKVFSASVWKEKVSFFILKEKTYSVDNKKEILKVFADKESEVKNFIRQNKLKFKKNKSASFKKVVGFYSSLNK